MAKIRLIQAKNYYKGRNRQIRFLIIHDMEAAAKAFSAVDTTAESIAGWMAGPNAPDASAHFLGDDDSVVQGVKVGDTAWGAKGANADGVHFEFKGFATWTRATWLSHDNMLNLLAAAAAEVVVALRRFGQTVNVDRLLTDAEVASRKVIGFTDHRTISRVFRIKGGHTDPGTNFPYDVFLAKVRWFIPNIHELHFV